MALSGTFCVSLGYSDYSAPLSYGIPQGSILRPLPFSLDLLPLGFMVFPFTAIQMSVRSMSHEGKSTLSL